MASTSDNLTLYRYKRTNKGYTEDLGKGVSLTLMLIPAGRFMMGNPKEEIRIQDSNPSSPWVEVIQFLMGRYPVTQAQWRIVASYGREDIDLNPKPSRFEGDDLPVEQVSWYEATEFCKRLSTRTGKHYHLPSERQWEYACRAETETDYHFGHKLTEEVANYDRKVGKTTPVGQYPANQWGLHDMHGNVCEWCLEHYYSPYEGVTSDGRGSMERGGYTPFVLHGGAWDFSPTDCRFAFPYFNAPEAHDDNIGFRVVCSPSFAIQ